MSEPEAKCRVVVSKEAGSSEEKLCGKDASVMWYVFASDEVTPLDILMACQEHDQRYEDHHTIAIKDLRGFVHIIQLPPPEAPPADLEHSQHSPVE